MTMNLICKFGFALSFRDKYLEIKEAIHFVIIMVKKQQYKSIWIIQW